MRTRGRKSAAELAVIKGSFGERPDPADGLTAEQAAIWREIVSSEPSGFFKSAAVRSLLADYCRHRSTGEMVSAIIESFKPEWLKSGEGAKRYSALLKMRDMEARAAGLAATRLRLTNQSRYTAQAAATATKNVGPRPWEE